MIGRVIAAAWLWLHLLTVFSPSAAAQEFCDNPSASCGRTISAYCLQRQGAGAVAADPSGACDEQFKAYRGCLQTVAEVCSKGEPQREPSASSSSVSPSGGSAKYERYCQEQQTTCLSFVTDDYDECRDEASDACLRDCRQQRQIARQSCVEARNTCARTGNFSATPFQEPACLTEFAAPPSFDPIAPTSPTPTPQAFGQVCRWGVSWCPMMGPGPVGTSCWCPDAFGNVAFWGTVSQQ